MYDWSIISRLCVFFSRFLWPWSYFSLIILHYYHTWTYSISSSGASCDIERHILVMDMISLVKFLRTKFINRVLAGDLWWWLNQIFYLVLGFRVSCLTELSTLAGWLQWEIFSSSARVACSVMENFLRSSRKSMTRYKQNL